MESRPTTYVYYCTLYCRHKLLDNVLLECERYLGYALLFPNEAIDGVGQLLHTVSRENLVSSFCEFFLI